MKLEATYRLGTDGEDTVIIDNAGWVYKRDDHNTEPRDWGGKGNAQRLYWLMAGGHTLGRVDIVEE